MANRPVPVLPQARDAVDMKSGQWSPAMLHWLNAIREKIVELEARIAALETP